MNTESEEVKGTQPQPAKVDRFAQVEALARKQSRFVKIQPGQTMVLRFDKDKFKPVEREINGKRSNAVEYTVVTPENEEKLLTLSLSWAVTVNDFLKEGFSNIKVSRRGAGLDTKYTFVPA